eukprot:137324_1
MSSNNAIVLDCGSGTIKAGFSGTTDLPSCVFPSVLGTPRVSNNCDISSDIAPTLFGTMALHKRGLSSLRWPIEHGIIVNWDDMEQLLHHTFFNELRIDPKEESVFLSEAALNPKANRERSAEILFETFNINSLSMCSQSILALYSSGRTTGIVVESGESVTNCVPIYEGCSVPQAISRLDLGGRDVTDYLVKLLNERGHTFVTVAEREIVRQIKENMCYVSPDCEQEVAKIDMECIDTQIPSYLNSNVYELPDGNHIELGAERCKAAEIMFAPKLIGSEQNGITQLICDAIMKTEIDIRRGFWKNIVVVGGNTMFRGFESRLNTEIDSISPKSVEPRIVAMEERQYCVWKGAAIISDVLSFREKWMTQAEYQEHGASRINVMTPF